MQNLVWKIVLILFILALCVWSVYPPEEKIRLGKDLRGGTSLIYLVNIPDEAGDRQAILAQTIEVLKERVNPTGVLDISMQPLGSDRIEIVMPLPNEQVKLLRAEYDGALDELLRMSQIRQSDLDEALRFNQAVERFGGASSQHAQDITALQDAYNKYDAAQQAWQTAKQNNVAGPELDQLEQTLADSQFEFEKLRDSFRKMRLDQGRVVRTMNLPNKREPKAGDLPDQTQRETGLANLKAEFPHLAAQIDKTVAAYDAYQAKRTTLDDPDDLMRLLRGAGVLEFRIAVRPAASDVNIQQMRDQLKDVGPDKTDSTVARWYPINELKQWYEDSQGLAALEADPEGFFSGRGLVASPHEGKYYLLLYATKAKSITHDTDVQWTVERTGRTVDNLGRPAVSFTLDQTGGNLMLRLTGPHVDEPMAIVLDGQVYSAPTINQAIGNSGIIQGEFSTSELDYLTRVLAAGALGARLSDQPIAMNTLGPSLGADNLSRGMKAFMLSVIVTVGIMLVYYFLAGFIANIALLCNAIIIFGVMAIMQGTFTLPGLAGIALSIAMAVDANVLIYERIREEVVNNKQDLRTAIRLGYQRAMNAIIDGNVAHLITCIVLLYTATTEVKGFAVTMILGVIATLFTALFVTRVLFTIYTEYLKARSLPMLPTVFPGIHKMLEPRVNWISKRYVFFTVSIIASIISLVLVSMQGSNMLDTEFRGGLSMTMRTRLAHDGELKDGKGRLLLDRKDVEARVQQIGERAGDQQPVLEPLKQASVLTLGETTNFHASEFQIKVGNPKSATFQDSVVNVVVDAVVSEFGDSLDVQQPLTFMGEGSNSYSNYTFPITKPVLGANIQEPSLRSDVKDYLGGLALVIKDIKPAVGVQDIETRIDRMRDQGDFRDTAGRTTEVIGLTPADPADPAKGYTSVAILVADPAIDFSKVDFSVWDQRLAAREWALASQALSRPASLEQVSEFSSAMAGTLRANAVVAILLSLVGMLTYIWIRFGSLRYSAATIVAVTHNVIICLGALALTHWLAGGVLASWLNLEAFWIDLNVIAALLTIIGYSLNDTIVILDRIRENRGKRLIVTEEIVNNSINQTFSRTILTGGSTIIASIILYVLGGTGIQPFAFTFLIGLLVGTYSSVTIAAPLVLRASEAKPPSPMQETRIEPRSREMARV